MALLLRPLLLLALVTGNPQDVANSLWGWSKLGLALDDETAAAANLAVERTAAWMQAEGVRQVFGAAAVRGCQLGSAAMAALRARERALKAQGLWW